MSAGTVPPELELPQRVTLPPMIVAAANAIASDATMSPVQRLEGVLVLIWGWAWYDRRPDVDPRMVQLPQAQWEQVCGFLIDGVPGDKLINVNLGLSFMNSGPSSYKD